MSFLTLRSSEQDFAAVHGKIRRGDILGVKGRPGTTIMKVTFVGFS